MNPIQTFIRQPVFTAMLVLAVVVFGLFSYPKIGVDQMPEVDFPVVTVTTVVPGADPETVEQNVSDPLEEALNTLGGIQTIRSVNVESVSQIVLQFSLDKPVDVAAQDVRDRVQASLSKLPAEAETPIIEKFDMGAAPILTLAVGGPLPVQELTRLAEDVVKPALQRLDGVGAITVFGGREREIQVRVEPALLRSFGVSVTDVTQALRAQSVDMPGGRTSEPGAERTVKLEGEARSVEALRELVIASPGGIPVRIRDVANVVDGPAEARSASSLDGQSAIGLTLQKQSGANTVQVAARVQEALSEIQGLLPEGSALEVVSDNARFIRASIHGVQVDLVLGGLLAVIIVLFFLRDWRATVVSAVALPTSVIGTFAAMYALGFTFNVVTMLALTLSIGLLIDDAIVVIENISRHLEGGAAPAQAAEAGTKEIALAVLAVTLTIVAVFVPVAFMEGIMGRFFIQFGLTVAVAVMLSYFVSMTLTPMLSARLLRHHGTPGRVSATIDAGLTRLEAAYRRGLSWMLSHRAVTVAAAVGTLVLTLGMARFINFTFMPAQDMSVIKLVVELPVGTPLERTARELESLREQVQGLPGVTRTLMSVGGGVQEEVHKGELLVNLVPIKDRAFDQQRFKQYLRETLVRGGDVKLGVQDVQSVSGGGNRPQAVQFNVRGDDWPEVVASAEKVRQHLLKNPGFTDVDVTYRPGKPQLPVELDREQAATLGVPAAAVGTALRAFLGGDAIGSYRERGETYDIRLRLPEAVLADPAQLGELTVRTASGGLVELRNLARFDQGEGPSQIDRQGLKRQITLLADLRDYSLSQAMTYLNDFAKAELPATVITDFEGQGKELGKAGLAFLTALLLGVVLMYMILAAQFESLTDPFVIMMSLPFAIIGALGGLLVTREFLSMFAMIGIIMLMGLVAKNGILIVEFTHQLKQRGKSTTEALLEAGPVRLRPILMTTIAMIAGMVPVALARGDGAETRAPMAVAIIGGLISSTVLTLGVVPVFYSLVDGLRGRLSRRRARGAPPPIAAVPAEAAQPGERAAG